MKTISGQRFYALLLALTGKTFSLPAWVYSVVLVASSMVLMKKLAERRRDVHIKGGFKC